MMLKLTIAVFLSCQAAALCVAPFPATRCAPTRQPLICAPRRAAVSMATATSTDDATAAFAAEAKRAAEAELNTPTIAELVETSFVRAVMDMSKGMVDTLKLFVAAVKAGYERSVPISEMEAALDAVERQTAGRPLLDEETELRSAWLSLVYLTLERRGVASTSDAGALEVAPRVRDVYEAAIDSILLKREIASVEFKDLKLRELLPGDEAKARNPIERAILSQSLKLIWVRAPRNSAAIAAQFCRNSRKLIYAADRDVRRHASAAGAILPQFRRNSPTPHPLPTAQVTLEVLEQEEEASEPVTGAERAARPFIPGTTGEKQWGPVAK